MKGSPYFKLYIAISVAACLLAGFLLASSLYFLPKSDRKALARYAESFSSVLMRRITPALKRGDLDTVDRLLKEHTVPGVLRVSLFDAGGGLLAPSGVYSPGGAAARVDPEVAAAAGGTAGAAIRFSEYSGQEMLFVAVPLVENGLVLAVLRTGVPVPPAGPRLGKIRVSASLAAGGIAVLSLLGVLLLVRRFTRSVALLADAVRRAAGGNFGFKIHLKRNDVFRELGDDYNRMVDRVHRYLTDLRSQKEELNCIVSSMQPGLLVLDPEGRVSTHNQSAERLLHADHLKNRRYWELLREPRLWDTIQAVQRKHGSINEEVEIDGSIYQVTTSHLATINETVMVFHDITDIKSLQRIKADFVTNVSHELRTPLTAIKGYAETIECADQENSRYLDIIKRHTNRLISIVEDLLALSELDELRPITQSESVDLETLVDHVLRMFEAGIREKKLRVEKRVEPGLPAIRGDSLRLEQLFINLIDNAIKYTEEGSIAIELRGHRSSVSVKVSDTGIGIPERHLPRIFERFYTVDKSRSRRLGGTGLGLSIVKHIVQLHGGSVEVRSAPGRGTDVTVRLPV